MSDQIQELQEKESVATGAESNTPVGKILVVDDEPELRSVLLASLRKQGYQVTGCGSGSEALAKLRERDFDLLLTDLMMPEMDGIALLKAALKVDPHLVGIIVTGQGTIQTAVDAMQIGAFDYVLKPFRMQTLMPVLTRAMNVRHLKLENVQLRETVAIHSLCQTISFTLDPQTVLSKLADAALQQSDADEVSILLPTNDGTELYVAAVRGERRERLLGERVPLQETISSWVARERTPLILNGEVRDERFVALWPRPEIRSAVSVPMQVANKLVGIINLNMTNRLRPFTLGQMKALTILASTAAAALESASLYTQVQQAEKNYRSIFENAVEGIFQSTLDGRFITANPAMARILGYASSEELISQVTDIGRQVYVYPEDRTKSTRLQTEFGLLHGFEFEAYRKNGDKIWLSLNRRSVRDEKGSELYHEGTIEDITEHKRAEERVKLSETSLREMVRSKEEALALLDTLLSSAPIGFAFYTPDLVYQRINKSLAAINGLPVAEHLGKTLREVLPEMAVVLEPLLQQVMDTGEPILDLEITGEPQANSTQEHHWLMSFYPVRMQAGELLGAGVLVSDITERKQAEAALRHSEERYRDLVENAHDLIYEHDLNGNYTATNHAGERMTGYSLEESLKLNLKQTVAPQYLEKAQAMLRQKLAGEKASAYELELIAKDGHHVMVEVNTRLVFKDGVPVGVQGIARDITERRRAEEALRESEARKRAILESSMDCIITMDQDGLVVDWNPAAETTFGYTQEETIGKGMAELIIPQRFRERHSQGLARYLATGEGRVLGKRLELNAERRDGTEFPIELTITRIQSQGALMFTGYLRDITERKKAEGRLAAQYAVTKALAESNTITAGAAKILQAICESLGWEYGALWTVDRDATVLRCSEIWQAPGSEVTEFASVSRESVFASGIGLPGRVWSESQPVWLADVIGESNFPRSATAARAGLHGGCAFPIQLRSEILGVVEFFSRSIRESDPELLAMMVTIGSQIGQFMERKRVETALTASEEQLRQSQKLEAIGQLAGGVAHDFNNLLTAINGYSALALRRLGTDHPISSYLEEIKKAGDRAANLTRQLLAFGRKQLLQPLALNVNDILNDMIKLLKRLIGEDIQLITRPGANLKQIKADPGQLEQVLVNLVVNARDAMPRGGTMTIETANTTLDGSYANKHLGVSAGEYVMLAISDTGTGMDQETQSRIFEPFFTTKEKDKGTGLGLSTVYGIVRQSGGNIWVYSELGKGTTFKVYLPLVEENAAGISEAMAVPIIKRGSETVLLVEDEDMVRKLASELLVDAGYIVLEANGGQEAIKLCKQHTGPIDLLITDVVMPKISGKQVAEQLMALHPETKVLFMSGYTDEAIVHHGVVDSDIAFIQKPFSERALAHKIREVLDSENGHK